MWDWLATKLWGSAEDLYRTTGFVASTRLKIWPAQLSIAEEEEEEEEEEAMFLLVYERERERERGFNCTR